MFAAAPASDGFAGPTGPPYVRLATCDQARASHTMSCSYSNASVFPGKRCRAPGPPQPLTRAEGHPRLQDDVGGGGVLRLGLLGMTDTGVR